MNVRAIAASAALLLTAGPLLGASAVPGLRSSGTIVVQANVQGEPLNIGGKIALYHKGSLYRIDLLSLGLPGTSGDLSALATSLIGPGGVSLVYDGTSGTVTAWSTANHTFYSAAPSHAAGTPAPVSPAPGNNGDPLSALANVAASLRDVQTATIQLTGHSMINGHPTTDLDVQMKRQQPGKPVENYHAQLALADDLGDFPVQLAFQSIAATKNAFGGTMKVDLTTVQRDTPDDSVFAVPQGYTRVSSLANVLRPTGR